MTAKKSPKAPARAAAEQPAHAVPMILYRLLLALIQDPTVGQLVRDEAQRLLHETAAHAGVKEVPPVDAKNNPPAV